MRPARFDLGVRSAKSVGCGDGDGDGDEEGGRRLGAVEKDPAGKEAEARPGQPPTPRTARSVRRGARELAVACATRVLGAFARGGGTRRPAGGLWWVGRGCAGLPGRLAWWAWARARREAAAWRGAAGSGLVKWSQRCAFYRSDDLRRARSPVMVHELPLPRKVAARSRMIGAGAGSDKAVAI